MLSYSSSFRVLAIDNVYYIEYRRVHLYIHLQMSESAPSVPSETATALPTDSSATNATNDAKDAPDTTNATDTTDATALLAKFNTTVLEFTQELQHTFPELHDTIEEQYTTLQPDDDRVLKWFQEHARPFHSELMQKKNQLFRDHDAVFLLPDINLSQLWKCKLTKANKRAIWKYLHVLMLLVSHIDMQRAATLAATSACATASTTPGAEQDEPNTAFSPDQLNATFEQWAKMLHQNHLSPEDTAEMRTHAESMMQLMTSLSTPDEVTGTEEDDDESDGSDGSDGGEDTDGGTTRKNKSRKSADFAKSLKDDPFLQKLSNSKIAQFAQELSSELDMSDLGLSPDAKVDSFQDVFGMLGKNPNGLMGLVQSVGNKIQNKMQSGDIKQSDLVSEAHNLMQSMQGSKAFKDMFQAMGKGAMGNGRKGKRGKKGRKGKRGKHGGGAPPLDPQQLFKTMAEQMGNLPPPTAEDMAGMQKMMAQMQQSATNTTNTPSTPSAPPTTTTAPAPAPASAPINTGELD